MHNPSTFGVYKNKNNNNKKALVPIFLGPTMDLQHINQGRLHVFFPPFYFIQTHTLCHFFNWCYFLLFLLMLFLVFLYYFSFLQLELTPLFPTSALVALLWVWSNHLKWLSLIFSTIKVTPIFLWISSFRILYFHLSILTISF